jgi:hypothetical protein
MIALSLLSENDCQLGSIVEDASLLIHDHNLPGDFSKANMASASKLKRKCRNEHWTRMVPAALAASYSLAAVHLVSMCRTIT